MQDNELQKIEKQLNTTEFYHSPIKNLIKLVDEIYIVLDEKNHINLFNERLSSIKSNMDKAINNELDKEQLHEVFYASKKEILQVLEESQIAH